MFNLDNADKTYDNYGDNNLSDLYDFLNTCGKNTPENITILDLVIKNITNIVMNGYEMPSYWLTIRVSKPTVMWNLPRWHYDGNWFGRTKERTIVSKFATTLKGAGTLLNKTNEDQREHFINIDASCNNLYPDPISIDRRTFMNDNIQGTRTQLKYNEGVIFFAGDKYKSGIHSEPPMNESRFFLSIVPGSKNEVESRFKNEVESRFKNKTGGGYDYFSKYEKYKNKYIQLKANNI
jgi:hypothetical protein